MNQKLTAEDARESLASHAAVKGAQIREKYGPRIGWQELQRLLQDRSCARYPCTIEFNAAPLLAGEFAHPEPTGNRPEDGFTMYVHPVFQTQLLELAPALVLYQLVAVNYGPFASAEDAESFGAAVLGLSRDEYYSYLCKASEQVPFSNNTEFGLTTSKSD